MVRVCIFQAFSVFFSVGGRVPVGADGVDVVFEDAVVEGFEHLFNAGDGLGTSGYDFTAAEN